MNKKGMFEDSEQLAWIKLTTADLLIHQSATSQKNTKDRKGGIQLAVN